MATRIKINSVAKLHKSSIIAFTPEGDFILKQRFGCDDPRILQTIRKIETVGSINPALWSRKVYKRKG